MLAIVLQVIAYITCIMVALSKDKKKILFWVFITNLFNFLIMLITKQVDGYLPALATLIRCALFLFKDRYKTNIVGYSCIIMHLTLGIVGYEDIMSLLTIIASVVPCYYQWFGNEIQIKKASMLSVTLWGIYSLHINLVIDFLKRLTELIFTTISLIKIQKRRKE